MKTLILVRHAKSSWKNPGQSDRDRPLNGRGKRDAPEMGQRLVNRGVVPDLMISSPAVRALKTAQAMAMEFKYPQDKIQRSENLYHAEFNEWLSVIGNVDSAMNTVLLFGHNPGITDLVNQLSGEAIFNIPTCGVSMLYYEIEEWKEIKNFNPSNFEYDFPKNAEG